MSFEQLVIVGNVGRAPELKETDKGIPFARFSLAVNKTIGKGEDKRQLTKWFSCTIWREKAITASRYITSGMPLLLIGQVSTSVYLDKFGKPQATLELQVDEFKFVAGRAESAAAAPSTANGNGRAATPVMGAPVGHDDPDDIPF